MNGTEHRKQMEAEMDVTVRGIFPGFNPNVTQEQVDGEIARCLERLRDGDFEIVSEFED